MCMASYRRYGILSWMLGFRCRKLSAPSTSSHRCVFCASNTGLDFHNRVSSALKPIASIAACTSRSRQWPSADPGIDQSHVERSGIARSRFIRSPRGKVLHFTLWHSVPDTSCRRASWIQMIELIFVHASE